MDGILIINKPKQYTSHDVVAKVKKICGEKVGHTGTLDPMATGVLPLLLGQGTKLSKYLINHDKTYIATIQLGKKTDTLDSEGSILEERLVDGKLLNKENVQRVLECQIGKQIQTPPIYSAIKVNGKKLYEYARKGVEVEIPKREIEIYNIELLDINEKDKTIEFRVHCSKGTYIRTLCENIAEKLGTIGYMKELNRVQVGQFNLNQAITVEELEKNKENEKFLNQHLITVQNFFEKYPIVELKEEKLKLFLNGVQLTNNNDDGLYQIKVNNVVVGIGTIKNKLLKREIIY
ncbi:tRNA pseudouridine synthase B [Clostridium sp. CAG:567]|nr:tRNA pseudouridine synthase B [Clostridium sp. CAG:567]